MTRQALSLPSLLASARLPQLSLARKINIGHFAFYRGWLEGLDLADLGDRYLPSGRDLPEAKKTLRWLQDELVAAAKRAKPTLARVLRLTPAQLKALASPSPPRAFRLTLRLRTFRRRLTPKRSTPKPSSLRYSRSATKKKATPRYSVRPNATPDC